MLELTHRQARDCLQTALDEALTSEQAAALERHLAGCADCRAYAHDLSRLQISLRQIGEQHRRRARTAPAPDLRGRLRRAPGGRAWPALTGGLAQAGSLALLAVVLWRLILAPGLPGRLESDGGAVLLSAEAPAAAVAAPWRAASALPASEFEESPAGTALELFVSDEPAPLPGALPAPGATIPE